MTNSEEISPGMVYFKLLIALQLQLTTRTTRSTYCKGNDQEKQQLGIFLKSPAKLRIFLLHEASFTSVVKERDSLRWEDIAAGLIGSFWHVSAEDIPQLRCAKVKLRN